jgi:hypothetical protein
VPCSSVPSDVLQPGDHKARALHVGVGVGVVALIVACGGPIPSAETPAPAAPTETVAGPPDAASTALAFHTITVTLCARDREACQRAQSSGAGEPTYRVAFGSSVGTLRSREQALADLYREIKSRNGAGTHLAAAPHRLERPLADSGRDPAPAPRPAAGGSDPIVDAAFQLIDAVDTQGAVTLDVAHGRPDCRLSMATEDADAGPRRRCLLFEESRSGRPEPEGPRGREEKFGR